METNKMVFENLFSLNVNGYTEKKNNLTYLSWSFAWAEVKKMYPDATYEIKKFGENNLPYVYDDKTGYMVFTSVTINGLTYEMWLPVMDNNNRAMKSEQYKMNLGKREFTVNAATMTDINKTIMRCLVKNLAMFGLGLYIYAGEDLPEPEQAQNDIISKLKGRINNGIKLYSNKFDIEIKLIIEELNSVLGYNLSELNNENDANKILEYLKNKINNVENNVEKA